MAESYLKNIHTRKIIAENVIFQNLPLSKYVQSKKACPKMVSVKRNLFIQENIKQ